MTTTIQSTLDRVKADYELQKIMLKHDLGSLRNIIEPAFHKDKFWELDRLYYFAEQITERTVRMQELAQQRRDLEQIIDEVEVNRAEILEEISDV